MSFDSKWFPDWHVIQVHYRTKDVPLRNLGYLGHPFNERSIVWYWKQWDSDEWVRARGFDAALQALVESRGFSDKTNTVIWPYQWVDHWLKEE